MPGVTAAALNRATLARQGLLAPLALGVADGLRAIGAVQAQQWTQVPVALASRLAGFEPAALWSALDAGEVVTGIGIRGTLHLVAAEEHAAYAAVAQASGVGTHGYAWPVDPADEAIGAAVLAAAAAGNGTATPAGGATRGTAVPRRGPLTPAVAAAVAEAWIAEHPGALDAAALEARRAVGWRPLLRRADLVRVPASGAWSARTPPASAAAPWAVEGRRMDADAAVEAGVLAHLRAFGPAVAQDTAYWLGLPQRSVDAALRRLAAGSSSDLVTLAGPDGAVLHDLAHAPRPDEATPAPPRFLAGFDSLLLAYAPARRDRILPPGMREAVYRPGNLRIDPSFLVDGQVAGTWTHKATRRAATITLTPATKLTKTALRGLEREGDRLLTALAPEAATRAVVVTPP